MELWEVLDVAKLLGVSPASVRRLADEGKLKVRAMTPRGQRLFQREDAERLRRDRAGEGRHAA